MQYRFAELVYDRSTKLIDRYLIEKDTVAKSQDSRKNVKKAPQKTAKEKRIAKQEKKKAKK